MTPRRRANALQAHSLHCQGLTYRQIGARMQRSASTIAGYIKDFHAHRDEIAETLAADQLVHSLAGINNPDPDLHQQHIQAARELRLQVDTLDRLTDRRQRRDRRVFEEQSADSIRNLEAYEELAETLIKSGLWDDPTPLDRFWQTSHFPNEPNHLRRPAPRRGAQSTQPRRPHSVPLTSKHSNGTPRSTPNNPAKHSIKPTKTTQFPDQTRSNPNKPDHDRQRSPAKQGKSRAERRKSKKKRRQNPPEPPKLPKRPKPRGPGYPASWDNPGGYLPRRNEESSLVQELFGRPMS